MFRSKMLNIFKSCSKINRTVIANALKLPSITIGFASIAKCEEKQKNIVETYDNDSLEHEFLIRQATTVNINAATQLITVTLVAIHDTSERLREALTKEICLVKQASEWGEGTPPQHWDELVAVRGTLRDLKHNLQVLFSYMDYADKLATIAAEISYLSGNIAASDAICERIDHAHRTCNAQKQLTHDLQQESLQLQQQAIINSPHFEQKLKEETENDNK
ncbi:uncharacterized protein LOC131846466 [Achroia grisella]|uniref:uncharacterized protein LOC131846466 n=1 Tax=Achroia grisella TaxID=688607 RepID=UPI0027D2DDF0|nr:uncharacterized protein LOC131846466 [Achroia grisella]